MEERINEDLECCLQQKILLYGDLLQCFGAEKEALVKVDMDRLWRIAKEKESLCLKIEDLRRRIVAIVGPDDGAPPYTAAFLGQVSGSGRPALEGMCLTLQRLKSGIDGLRRENVQIADHSLGFLDELLSIIVGEAGRPAGYNSRRRLNSGGRERLLSREV